MVGGDSPRHGCFPLASARAPVEQRFCWGTTSTRTSGRELAWATGGARLDASLPEPSGVDSWPPGGLPLARRYMRVSASLSLVVRSASPALGLLGCRDAQLAGVSLGPKTHGPSVRSGGGCPTPPALDSRMPRV